MKNKKFFYGGILLIAAGAAYLLNIVATNERLAGQITSFEECIRASYPVMESYQAVQDS